MKLTNLEMQERMHTKELETEIREKIAISGGMLSFAKFMELALYAPGLGYYSAGKHKLGAGGDFLTAPEISPLFAKTLARLCLEIKEHLSPYDILELGAGSGVFAKDLLLELEVLGCLPRYYYILEVSAELRDRQQQKLKAECPSLMSRIQWLDRLPENGIEGMIFANEVMDALPVHLFEVKNHAIKERCVTWQDEKFSWILRDPVSDDFIEKTNALPNDFTEGYQSELHVFLSAWIETITTILKKGIILLFDYGYGRAEYYHPDRTMGTLMCYYQHQKHANPLMLVGLQDITAHIDFTTVIESANDCELAGYTTQGAFLTAYGIVDLLQNDESISLQERFQQTQAIKKLIFPTEMGELIKVMALSKNWNFPLKGFSLVDRKRDL